MRADDVVFITAQGHAPGVWNLRYWGNGPKMTTIGGTYFFCSIDSIVKII